MNLASSDPLIGQTLDKRYRVRSRIARGGMGMVYLAEDLRLQRRVAVKTMHTHLLEDQAAVRRFQKEAQAAARLNDQNVVNVFDQGFFQNIPYLVMEYVPGITLRQLLKQQKRLTAPQVIEISEAVLRGLAAAHRAGFVHRDIKPENIFLADDGKIKVGDFGLARPASNNTTTGQALLGTIAYLSPELVTRGVADARSDVYAFGIMLYEMLTGVQPFRGEQAMQVAFMHANEDVPMPSVISKESTPELDELVRWTTCRDPEKRPRNAQIVLERMQQLLNGGLEGATKVLEGEPNAATTQLPQTTAYLTQVAPQTTSAIPASAIAPETQLPQLPKTAIEKAQEAANKRKKRGRVAAFLVAGSLVAVTGGSWWIFQGPGAQLTVPDVTALTLTKATKTLQETGFANTSAAQCTSPKIPAGKVVKTTPAAGERAYPEAKIQVCVSNGPKMLPVPQLVGTPLENAKQNTKKAGFKVGKVLGEKFGDAPAGTVIAAYDTAGAPLADSYREQGVIDFVVAAGPLPKVTGETLKNATRTLAAARLTVANELNQEIHHDTIAAGQVIELLVPEQGLSAGDRVGLVVSLGPELVTVPDVTGLRVNEAIAKIEAAGLKAATGVPALLRNAVRVNDTTPAAGKKVPKGSTVELGFEL